MTEQNSYGESSEVTWQLGSTTMYGTVVRPSGPGPFPAVVMVAGSGPTDRDWNSPLLPGTNGSARLLAEALARAGIASLRYDKRASGPHARENVPLLIGKMSMQSHVDELAGAVRVMASQMYTHHGRIFALANSEGTLHALNYQLHSPEIPFAGLVLIGPPGRAVGAVARSQLAAEAAHVPNGEALLMLYDAAIARFLAGDPIAPDPLLPEGVQMLLRSLETPANLPLARELWMANAAPLLRQVNVPVLVIIGKKDVQVDWQTDGEPLQRAAAGHEEVTFLFPVTTGFAVVLGYVVLRSGSILLAAYLHALNDQVTAFIVALGYKPFNPAFSFGVGIYGIATLALVALLVLRDPVWQGKGSNLTSPRREVVK